jgi:heat shock protein HslJ
MFETPQTAAVEDTTWILGATVVGGDAFVHTAIDSDIFIKLVDGQMSGSAGCNSMMGSYVLQGDSLTFGPLATTKKMCEPERNEREGIVLELLAKVASASVERQTLSLYDSDNFLLMTFRVESDSRGEQTLFVGAEQVDCVGVGPQKCLLIREDPNAEWSYFYDAIEGFEWEAGFEYELRVNISEVENPPADGSSLRYELIEVVNKTAVNE